MLSLLATLHLSAKPNILFMLTDDMDVVLGAMTPMKKLRAEIVEKGTWFSNAFVHTPICCPSRSSFLSGMYLHNGGARENDVGHNCVGQEWVDNNERTTFGPRLQAAGYATHYAGKYLNQYASPLSPGLVGNCTKDDKKQCMKSPSLPCNCARIPPGWSSWHALVGNSQYYNYSIIQGVTNPASTPTKMGAGKWVSHGDTYQTDYFPDVVANATLAFIHEMGAPEHKETPIFVVNAWPTPHGPHTPAPQFAGRYVDKIHAPRTPSYNASDEAMATKSWIVKHQSALTPNVAQGIDFNYAQRWESLLSVDDHIAQFIEALKATGRYEATYVIFTSDHGFQLGQHRLPGDKRHEFENDLRIPFVVMGPRIGVNKTIVYPVLNIDVAPTIVEIATGVIPKDMDGDSFLRLFAAQESNDEAVVTWRSAWEIEYNGQYNTPCDFQTCPAPPMSNFHENDGKNNTYQCVRTMLFASDAASIATAEADATLPANGANKEGWYLPHSDVNVNTGEMTVETNSIYCEFGNSDRSGGTSVFPAAGSGVYAGGFSEFFDLKSDPWQLDNSLKTLKAEEVSVLRKQLKDLRECRGKECRAIGPKMKMKMF